MKEPARTVYSSGRALSTGRCQRTNTQNGGIPHKRAIQAAPQRSAHLLDLTGDGAMAIGAVSTLGSGNKPRRLTQQSGRAIYEDLRDLNGVQYRAAHQGGLSVAVWDRVGELHARPSTPAEGLALQGPLASRVTAALARQRRRPIWIDAADCQRCRKAGIA
jgi:hypothetical protein